MFYHVKIACYQITYIHTYEYPINPAITCMKYIILIDVIIVFVHFHDYHANITKVLIFNIFNINLRFCMINV